MASTGTLNSRQSRSGSIASQSLSLTCSTFPRRSTLRMTVPSRRRRPVMRAGDSLPLSAVVPPTRHVCRAPRPGATRLGRPRSPEYRHLPTLRPGASHRRRMLAAFPRVQPHRLSATARRPSDGIASHARRYAPSLPCPASSPSLIVSPWRSVAALHYRPCSTLALANAFQVRPVTEPSDADHRHDGPGHSLEHALSQSSTPAFEAQEQINSASPNRPPSCFCRYALQ